MSIPQHFYAQTTLVEGNCSDSHTGDVEHWADSAANCTSNEYITNISQLALAVSFAYCQVKIKQVIMSSIFPD